MPIIVRDACEACFDAHKDDCSGFVRAVAASLGVTLQGLADDIVVTIRTDPGWRQLQTATRRRRALKPAGSSSLD